MAQEVNRNTKNAKKRQETSENSKRDPEDTSPEGEEVYTAKSPSNDSHSEEISGNKSGPSFSSPKKEQLPSPQQRIYLLLAGALSGLFIIIFVFELLRLVIFSLAGLGPTLYFQSFILPRFIPTVTASAPLWFLIPMLSLSFVLSIIGIELTDMFLRRAKTFRAKIFLFAFEFIIVTYFLFSGFFLLFRIALGKYLPPEWEKLFGFYPAKSLEENLIRVLSGAMIVFLYSGFAMSRTKNSLTGGEEKFSFPGSQKK